MITVVVVDDHPIVRDHVSTIIGKLQAADRGEAVVRARELGFGAGRT